MTEVGAVNMTSMTSRIPRVTEARALKDYWLRLTFDDGLTGDVDLSELPDKGPVFQPLRGRDFFALVGVNPDTHTVEWPGGIDLDPESLRDEAAKNRVTEGKRAAWHRWVAILLSGRRHHIMTDLRQ
jgi:hypothetical protein